jgi:acyl transferase domain-containing protein
MDPQQRLLLEVAAEAFDHAGIDPGALDKNRTGVFVGASSADHSTLALQDPTVAASHFMLGNVLSILANRISFAWDLRGPSVTIDTACSSSLVALDQARAEIESGRIDTAVVAGVNLLLSPIPFVGFSQAGMLSPSGLCSPFGARADGYVRAEGALVFILQRASVAREAGLRIRAHLVGTGVNTAGRGTSITVPSGERQAELIGAVLESAGHSAEDIVYLEAHGTGTPVGDPIEAWAISTSLAQRRANPLPIGSVKSNIGHLEPASGLAGLLKAQLILEHGFIPATIHADNLNPGIDFTALGLSVVREGRALDRPAASAVIGVNSFGFGGVNAHALLRGPEAPKAAPAVASVSAMPPSLMITAPTKAGLAAQVDRWRALVADPLVAA